VVSTYLVFTRELVTYSARIGGVTVGESTICRFATISTPWSKTQSLVFWRVLPRFVMWGKPGNKPSRPPASFPAFVRANPSGCRLRPPSYGLRYCSW